MKKEIAKNDKYEMYVDKTKNRFYTKLIGYWQYTSEVPNYIDDVKKMLEHLSPGYTMLVDNRDAKTPTPEIMQLHIKGLEICNEEGLGKTALVEAQAIVKIAGGRALRESGIEETSRQFNDIKEAEDWLDGKDV